MTYDTEAFVRAYVKTGLWSALDEQGEPLDAVHRPDDVTDDSLADMRADCEDFIECNAEDLVGIDPEQAGHDFWLTRNGHGAGFWDRGLGEKGDRLTANSKPYGECSLCVGDDGYVHYHG